MSLQAAPAAPRAALITSKLAPNPAAARRLPPPPRCRRSVAAAARRAEPAAIDGSNVRSSASHSSISDICAVPPISNTPQAPVLAPGRLEEWQSATRRLLRLATLLTLPDFAARAAAHAATAVPSLASSDAWVPLASNCVSFLILSSVFVNDGEREAAACYVSGLVGSLTLLLQLWLLGSAPPPLLLVLLLLASGGVAMNAALLHGCRGKAPQLAAAWQLWRGVLGAVGFAVLPQVFYLSVVLPSCGVPDGAAASASWAPAAAGLCLFAGLGLALQARWLPRSCWEMWDVPAWTATLLFMLEPLAALAAATCDPSSLAAASPAAYLLPALVTGLQVPRALLARDHMWTTGTSWATAFACLQAALAAAATGQAAVAAAFVAVPMVAAAWLLRTSAAVEGHSSPLQPLQPIAAAYRRQLRPWRQLSARLRSTVRRGRVAA